MPATSTPTSLPASDPSAALRQLLVESINWAFVEGHSVAASGELGVICESTHARERWKKDPKALALNPLGAAILQRQPPAVTDPDQAACIATGQGMRWVTAFSVGVAGLAPITSWGNLPCRELMVEAWLLGVEIRAMLGTRSRRARVGA